MTGDVRADDDDDLDAVSALAEPSRRALYEFAAASGRAVSRDEAAAAVGLERNTAAHHLDRLAAEGLLEVEYRRLSGRQGPGAGRPSKLYRRSARQFDVSLPPRDYELVSRLLAAATDRARRDRIDVDDALDEVCSREGRTIAERARQGLRRTASRRTKRAALFDTLTGMGYEPAPVEGARVVLRNCPFHDLARRYTDLVCSMNLCLLRTAADELDAAITARLEPQEGLCCVQFTEQ